MPRICKYVESKMTWIMKATVPHVTAWAGGMKYQADGFLFDGVYIYVYVTGNKEQQVCITVISMCMSLVIRSSRSVLWLHLCVCPW